MMHLLKLATTLAKINVETLDTLPVSDAEKSLVLSLTAMTIKATSIAAEGSEGEKRWSELEAAFSAVYQKFLEAYEAEVRG